MKPYHRNSPAQTGMFSHLPIFEVKLVKERELTTARVTTPEDAGRIFCEFFEGCDREKFAILLLATNGMPLGVHVVSVGTVNASLVSPRETFRAALLHGGPVSGIVLGHNHPSGNLEPSREDLSITKRLVEAGKLLDVPVRDHLIIGHGGQFISFAERGLM